MGDWHVLINLNGDPHLFVVEQHQDEPVVPPPTPQFDIEIRYWTPANGGPDNGRFKTGWRYVVQWRANGRTLVESNYGYATPDRAKQAAEYRATQIAQSLAPIEKYRFTPEV